ncbi:MAG: PAS domain-containing protein [Rubrivivax sp.]|nr:PAS domain-containing protein [Rubrivivax sp.]MBP6464763.1 PAS domain-containing protein [Rubrivivax sp.]
MSRRLAVLLTLLFVATAAALLLAFAWVGQRALEREHEAASLRVAALFEASLRQAMLQRDLPGLAQLLQSLGSLPGLRAAALLEPGGQVRFSSQPQRLLADEAAALKGLCLGAGCGPASAPALHWLDDDAGRVLRVAYPVRNATHCTGCHGDVAWRPVNGVLLLDFQPMAGERFARERALGWLLPVVLAALLLLGAAVAWVLRRQVLKPLRALATQVDRLAEGDLSARSGLAAGGEGAADARPASADELARLGRGLDDMAERVRSLLDARSAQGRFLQALLDASPDAVVVIDDQHRIVLANAAYGRLLGHDAAAVVGQACHRSSRGLAEPCPRTLVCCPLAECLDHGRPLSTVMALHHVGGADVDVEIHAAPLQGEDGRRLVVQVIRRLDEQVRFSQEQRLSAIGLLANGVAHEIHNPLASIRLALQSGLRGLRDGSMPQAELVEYLELVDRQIDRCVLITQRLLRLSQPSAEQAQPVSVAAAVADVLALLAAETEQARIEVQVDLLPADLRVLGDEGELRQVLVNLVQNAVHAMPEGGQLRVEGRAHAGEGDGARSWVRVAVQDSGVGIAPEHMPLIFLPFYSRRADGRRGTGLGLAISKGLVEQRGGELRASSRPGHGSRFELDLPDAGLAPTPALPRP